MSGSYPLDIEVEPPATLARWRPLVNWALVIPLNLWAVVLSWGALVVGVVGWFAIVFTGELPLRLGEFQVAVLRYQWRMLSYLYGLTDSYPSFAPVAGYVDPGDYPAVLYSARAPTRRRWSVALRAVLLLPQIVVLYLVSVAAAIVLVLGWWAVLFTGRWPRSLQTFVIGWMRWYLRVLGYAYLVTDVYPPMSFEA